MFIAEFSYRLPFFRGGADVIVKIAVVVGLGDKRRNVAVCFLPYPFESLHVKPRNYYIVRHVLGQNTGVIRLHSPWVVAVIVALKEDYLFLAGKGAGAEHRKGGGVGAVLHKIRPVSGLYRIH